MLLLRLTILLLLFTAPFVLKGDEVQKAVASDPLNAKEEITKQEHEFAKALASNDAVSIDKWLGDDWTYIGSEGEMMSKAELVEAMKSGKLKFQACEVRDLTVRTYGTAAVVTGRSSTKGSYEGKGFSETERFTDVFIRVGDKWHCVATHCSPSGH